MNKVLLLGRLGAAPETRNLSETSSVTQANLATSERYTNKNGEKVETTEWHRLVIWNKSGEIFAQYLDKGSEVVVEGKMATRNYDDKDGIKRYVTEVIVSSWHFTGGSKMEQNGYQQQQTYQQQQQQQQQSPIQPSGPDPNFPSDLPF